VIKIIKNKKEPCDHQHSIHGEFFCIKDAGHKGAHACGHLGTFKGSKDPFKED